MDPVALIALLSDGQFHSGSELGASLGVSRTAIWKSLSLLPDYGLELEAVKGKGYRLASPIELFNAKAIASDLAQECIGAAELEIVAVTDSTNTHIASLSRKSDKEFLILLAEMQTDGRGRRGRRWVSPFGRNIYLSAMFDLRGGPDVLAGLSLVVGISLVRAIKKFADLDLALKWPNDVFLDGKKVAGVLVELQGEATTGWTVIVGVGVNYGMEQEQGSDIDQPWAAFSRSLVAGRNALAASIISELMKDLQAFKVHGFEVFRADWNALDFFRSKSVHVVGSELSGVSLGVDGGGNLKIKTATCVELINAGEVSVRGV